MVSSGGCVQHENRRVGACVDRHPMMPGLARRGAAVRHALRFAMGGLTLAALAACSGMGGSGGSASSSTTSATSATSATSTTSTTTTSTSGPVIDFQPSPSSVAAGAGTTLAWKVSGAASCLASGGWSGTKPLNGSAAIETLGATTTFTLTCQGPGGASTQSTEVIVAAPAPSVSLVAKSTTLGAGMTTMLTWAAQEASACTASGGWSGNVPTSGSQATAALAATTIFTITCTGAGGTATQSTTVTVASTAPSITISATPSSVTSGQTAGLTWTTRDATACEGSGAWSGPKPLSGSLTTGALAANTTYSLSCTGPAGSATQTAVISVTPAVPTVSFAAMPSTIVKGSSAMLSWSSANATSCVGSGAWIGVKALAGSQSTGIVPLSSTYILTCKGTGGTATQSTTVSVAASTDAPTVSLSVGPSAIESGESSTLNWSATHATSCFASGAWTGEKPIRGSQSTGSLTSTSTYTLTCRGPGGGASQTATVSVTPPLPTISLSASPSTITTGSSSSLTWLTSHATKCTAGGDWSGSRAAKGSESTGALHASASYSLTCSGPGGVATQAVTVTVTTPAPTVTISASPTTVKSGSTATLEWSSTDATSCVASGGWTGAEPLRGSQTTVALSNTTDFTLTCQGKGGSASQSVTVTVAAAAPTVSLSASPSSISSGATSMLTWTSTNASACTASGGWSGSLAISGSKSTPALTQTTTYTLTCTGSAGTARQSTTVVVSTSSGNGAATLSWSAPTTNTNGTAVTPLTGYTVFYGTSPTNLTKSVAVSGANTLSYQITGLSSGTWYFAVAADAADGTQSALSKLGSKTI